MVKPMKETPICSLWLSNADLIFPTAYHTKTVYFYRSTGAAGFFDTGMLKAALSRALVDFYPYAGKLRKDGDGRIEINCNGEGILFVEAGCDGAVAELGDFSPTPDITLIPARPRAVNSLPMRRSLLRLRHPSLSLRWDLFPRVAAWSAIARGKTAATAAVPPSFSLPRDPPRPRFPHLEHQPAPSLKIAVQDSNSICSTFRLTRGQVNALKRRCGPNHTTFEVVVGHMWCCANTARGLPGDQETRLQLPVEMRRQLRPPLPPGFIGNEIFYAAALASCGELVSKPLSFAVGKVNEAIVRVADQYTRSALDYVELHGSDSGGGGIMGSEKCPNMTILSWAWLPFDREDFGWGIQCMWAPVWGRLRGRFL